MILRYWETHYEGIVTTIGMIQSPYIAGFSSLYNLLGWSIKSERILLKRGKVNSDRIIINIGLPLVYFKRSQYNEQKVKSIFDSFQEKREERERDNPKKRIPPRGIILDFKYYEKRKADRFLEEHPELKYFVICNAYRRKGQL